MRELDMDRRLWTADDLEELRARYPVDKASDIAASLNRTTYAIRRKAGLLGLEKSDGRYSRLHTHYSIKVDSFSALTSRTAYTLGMILADGSVNGDRLKVTNNRADVMHEVREAIGSNHPLPTARGSRDRSISLYVVNRQLVNSLRAWSVSENKSLNGTWPSGLPDELFGHVLRGYFDGDGHANYSRRGGLRVKFTSGSPLLLRGLADELHTRIGTPLRGIEADKGRPNANRLWYYGASAQRLADAMYGSGGFHIVDKRRPFLDYEARLVN